MNIYWVNAIKDWLLKNPTGPLPDDFIEDLMILDERAAKAELEVELEAKVITRTLERLKARREEYNKLIVEIKNRL